MKLQQNIFEAQTQIQRLEVLAKRVAYLNRKDLGMGEWQRWLHFAQLNLIGCIDHFAGTFAWIFQWGDEIVICFRGSKQPIGAALDTRSEQERTFQYEIARSEIISWLGHRPVVCVGHGLGGAIAQRAAHDYSPWVSKCFTFSATGVPTYYDGSRSGNTEVEHYVILGDPASRLGDVFISGWIQASELIVDDDDDLLEMSTRLALLPRQTAYSEVLSPERWESMRRSPSLSQVPLPSNACVAQDE